MVRGIYAENVLRKAEIVASVLRALAKVVEGGAQGQLLTIYNELLSRSPLELTAWLRDSDDLGWRLGQSIME